MARLNDVNLSPLSDSEKEELLLCTPNNRHANSAPASIAPANGESTVGHLNIVLPTLDKKKFTFSKGYFKGILFYYLIIFVPHARALILLKNEAHRQVETPRKILVCRLIFRVIFDQFSLL